jgi:hypothetical protein
LKEKEIILPPVELPVVRMLDVSDEKEKREKIIGKIIKHKI